MTRRALWITVVLAAVLLPTATIGYWMFPQWESVPDVTRQSELVLHPRAHQNSIYGISIRVSGQIEGNAQLVILDGGGKQYRVFELSGDVDVDFTGDWYSDEVALAYKPIQVRGGILKLRYSFYPWYPTDSI